MTPNPTCKIHGTHGFAAAPKKAALTCTDLDGQFYNLLINWVFCIWVNDKLLSKALKACIRNIGQVKRTELFHMCNIKIPLPEVNPGREGTQWLFYTTLSQRAGMKNNFSFVPHVAMGSTSWKWVNVMYVLKILAMSRKISSEPILYDPMP